MPNRMAPESTFDSIDLTSIDMNLPVRTFPALFLNLGSKQVELHKFESTTYQSCTEGCIWCEILVVFFGELKIRLIRSNRNSNLDFC